MTQIVVIAKEPVAGRVKTRLTPPYTPAEAAALATAALEDTLETVARSPFASRVLALDGSPGGWLPARRFTVIPQRGRGLDERLAAAFTDAYRLHPVPVVLIGMDTPQVTPALLATAANALTCHDPAYGPTADRLTCHDPAYGPTADRLTGHDPAYGPAADAPTPMYGPAADAPSRCDAAYGPAADALASMYGPPPCYDAVYGPAADGGFWLLGLRRPDPSLLLGVPMSQPWTGAAQLERLRQAGLTVCHLPELQDVDTAEDARQVAAEAPYSRFAAAMGEIHAATLSP